MQLLLSRLNPVAVRMQAGSQRIKPVLIRIDLATIGMNPVRNSLNQVPLRMD